MPGVRALLPPARPPVCRPTKRLCLLHLRHCREMTAAVTAVSTTVAARVSGLHEHRCWVPGVVLGAEWRRCLHPTAAAAAATTTSACGHLARVVRGDVVAQAGPGGAPVRTPLAREWLIAAAHARATSTRANTRAGHTRVPDCSTTATWRTPGLGRRGAPEGCGAREKQERTTGTLTTLLAKANTKKHALARADGECRWAHLCVRACALRPYWVLAR
jgi:hypothetical protein